MGIALNPTSPFPNIHRLESVARPGKKNFYLFNICVPIPFAYFLPKIVSFWPYVLRKTCQSFSHSFVWALYYFLLEYYFTFRSFILCVALFMYLFIYFCSTGAWTQGLHLEPLFQPFSVLDIFEIGSHGLFVWGWLWTAVLLIFASWVARITGMSHWCLAYLFFFYCCAG
jgi:hypothetical protein